MTVRIHMGPCPNKEKTPCHGSRKTALLSSPSRQPAWTHLPCDDRRAQGQGHPVQMAPSWDGLREHECGPHGHLLGAAIVKRCRGPLPPNCDRASASWPLARLDDETVSVLMHLRALSHFVTLPFIWHYFQKYMIWICCCLLCLLYWWYLPCLCMFVVFPLSSLIVVWFCSLDCYCFPCLLHDHILCIAAIWSGSLYCCCLSCWWYCDCLTGLLYWWYLPCFYLFVVFWLSSLLVACSYFLYCLCFLCLLDCCCINLHVVLSLSSLLVVWLCSLYSAVSIACSIIRLHCLVYCLSSLLVSVCYIDVIFLVWGL